MPYKTNLTQWFIQNARRSARQRREDFNKEFNIIKENNMMQLWNYLKGKKTYIIVVLTVILGLLTGDQEMVMLALMGAGLRNGMN